jgi:hypothetical protein
MCCVAGCVELASRPLHSVPGLRSCASRSTLCSACTFWAVLILLFTTVLSLSCYCSCCKQAEGRRGKVDAQLQLEELECTVAALRQKLSKAEADSDSLRSQVADLQAAQAAQVANPHPPLPHVPQ